VTYTALTGCGLLLAAVWDLLVLRTGLLRRRGFWVSYLIMVVFQLMVNGVLAGVGVVEYNRHTLLGPRLAYAPIEDIGFGFTFILITVSTWMYLAGRDR
jgi:lycopene cyclase domain-containing protein